MTISLQPQLMASNLPRGSCKYKLSTDDTGNTVSNSYSIAACIPTAVDVFLRTLPSNGRHRLAFMSQYVT
jgi:hypothetical protein